MGVCKRKPSVRGNSFSCLVAGTVGDAVWILFHKGKYFSWSKAIVVIRNDNGFLEEQWF